MQHSKTFTIGGREITLETGELARQAHGSVVVRQGRALVLVTVVASREPRPGADFFPLTVEYREKTAAAGRVPGGFLRREGRISDDEVLCSRIVDRSIRPLFPKGFRHEVQVQATVFSADAEEVDAGILALMGAGAALHLSPLPSSGPVGGLRGGWLGGRFVALPAPRDRPALDVDLVVAAGREGLVMVEGGARQAPEARVKEVLLAAQKHLAPFHDAVDELRRAAGAPRWEPVEDGGPVELRERVEQLAGDGLDAVVAITDKAGRRLARDELAADVAARLEERDTAAVARALGELLAERMRRRVLSGGPRLDGRGPAEVRPITCRAGFLPSTHGSAVFTRGRTQAVVSCTLASQRSEQTVETLGGMEARRFLLHYNFPAYSVGEVRPLKGPGRREIGHGALALRALDQVVPDFGAFPYVLRVESDITESNGSSSMATVCGASLALMDAGVPLLAPVAGIAMGLIAGGEGEPVILTDILGDEDQLGDMDFKVAGTREGVTALQMDNKLGFLGPELLERALAQACEARLQVLDAMQAALPAPRAEVAGTAPRSYTVRIQPDAVSQIIGPRGQTIRSIQDRLGVELNVDDQAGVVTIFGSDGTAARKALAWVRDLGGIVETGRLYRGSVTGVTEKLAFVRIFRTAEGAVHVSEWAEEHVPTLESAVAKGDEVVVRVLGADGRGRLRLSRKAALDAGTEEVVNEERPPG